MESEGNKLYFGVINLDYDPPERKRSHAWLDKPNVKELFTEILHFSPHKQVLPNTGDKEASFANLSKEKLQVLLQGVVEELKSNRDYRYVAGFFSGHGCEKLLCRIKGSYVMEHFVECISKKTTGDKDQYFPTFALLDMFNIADLDHITKIFLIQACRSSKLSAYEDTQDYGGTIMLTDKDSDTESKAEASSSQNQEESPQEKLRGARN